LNFGGQGAGWLLDEPLSLAQLIGAALAIAGVALVGRNRSRS
jgi:drug/metabolite transporter (DMT)-like permease